MKFRFTIRKYFILKENKNKYVLYKMIFPFVFKKFKEDNREWFYETHL